MNLAPGMVLAGRYRLERKIGAGGMGEVWAAKNWNVGTDVAVKVLLTGSWANSELVLRFRREAALLARIRNDHVARVLDFASDEGVGLVLVMDLVDGEPVSDVLARSKLSVEDAIELAIDVLRGLADLHRASVVHRDIKPGNVILEPRSDGSRKAVIVDFGLGRLMLADDETEASGITRRDIAVGTLEYMAPEQILNSSGVTGAADIYALGAMLFRAVHGAHMFGDATGGALAQEKLLKDPPKLRTGRVDVLARAFEGIVDRAIRRKRPERYARAEDMLAELLQLRNEMPQPVGDEDATTLFLPKGKPTRAPRPTPVAEPGLAQDGPPRVSRTIPYEQAPQPYQQAMQVPPTYPPRVAAPVVAMSRRGPGRALWIGALAVVVALALGFALGVVVTARRLAGGALPDVIAPR